jgi:hypothetical protein
VRLLLLRAVHDDALRPDADVGSDEGAEGDGGIAERFDQAGFLKGGEAETVELLGDGQAEETEVAHLLHDLLGDVVLVLDPLFGGDQAFARETVHGVEKLAEGVVVDHQGSFQAVAARRKRCRANSATATVTPIRSVTGSG